MVDLRPLEEAVRVNNNKIVQHMLRRASKHGYIPSRLALGLAIENPMKKILDSFLKAGGYVDAHLFAKASNPVTRQ